MARARNIKPGFFKNYDLADQGPIVQLLFAGLWCLADKEGRLKDQPRFIKAEIFPYYECDVNGELTKLERLGFVRRYVASGMGVIEILNFKKHQSPHHTEKESTLPAFAGVSACIEKAPEINGELTVNPPKQDGGNPPDSLIPDSLIPDSRTKPLSGKPDALKELNETADRVIDFLNAKSGKAFRHKEANRSFIRARLSDGATEQDCKSIIARKVRDWQNTEQWKYMRPETLFNAKKFESYVGELVVPQPQPWDGAK